MAAARGKTPTSAGPNIPPGSSRQFITLIKAIGEAGSNHEEDRIIRKEAAVLEARLKEPNIPVRQMKEYLVRLIYCEMLGHDVAFGHFQAVRMTQSVGLLEKRVGYLASCVLLHEHHELIVLLINTLQRDLKSSNLAEICMALTTISRLMNAEMTPAVLPLVVKHLTHEREIVRKKAVLALHRCFTRTPDGVIHLADAVRRALCDSDPSVMCASLNLLYDMALADPAAFKDLTSSFVSILKQIIEHRLVREFDYHKVPAPWMQVKLLKVLAILGADDQSASESMYEVIRDCLQRAETQGSAAYAIVYECICTITKIYPSVQLVELAARSVGRFLQSDNNNLKYLGITALASIVMVNPVYAAEHQMVVIDCLDDPDETLKRKTLDLLCKMTNPVNVTVIIEKLLTYLRTTVDVFLRKDLVPRITQLAERFAPDNSWFVETMNALFEIAGNLVQPETAYNLMRLIAEGTDDEEQDNELRISAAESYIELLEKPKIPDLLVCTMCWVVGEYAYLAPDYDQTIVLELLVMLLDRKFQDDLAVKCWVVSAIAKMVARAGELPPALRAKIDRLKQSHSLEIQQRCYELTLLLHNPAVMRRVLPTDASCEDIETDVNLTFLDGYVTQALRAGCKAYVPASQRAPTIELMAELPQPPALKFEAYARPKDMRAEESAALFAGISRPAPSIPLPMGTLPSMESDLPISSTEVPAALPHSTAGIQVTQRRWGKKGDMLKATEDANAEPAHTVPSFTHAAPAVQPAPSAAVTTDLLAEDSSCNPFQPAQPETSSISGSRDTPVLSQDEMRKQQLASALFATGAAKPKKARISRAKKRGGADDDDITPTTSGSLLGDMIESTPTTPRALAVSSSPGRGHLPSTNPLEDLLGFSSTATTPSGFTQTAQQGPPPSYDQVLGGHDLNGFFESSSAPSTPQARPTVHTLDLLGGLDLMASEQSTAPSVPSKVMPPVLNLLEDDFSSGPAVLPVQGVSSIPLPLLGNLSFDDSSQVPLALKQHEHELVETSITSDPALEVTYAKVWRRDALILVLFYRNKTSRMLAGTVTQLTFAPELTLLEDTHATFTCSIDGHGIGRQVLTLGCGQPASGMSVKGQISYTDAGLLARNAYFNVSLQAADFLRSCELSTDEYGQAWEKVSAERKQRFSPTPFKTPEQLVAMVKQHLHLSLVQIIGNEAILCGQVLTHGNLCLMHTKVTPSGAEITVRTEQAMFSEAVLRNCAVFCK